MKELPRAPQSAGVMAAVARLRAGRSPDLVAMLGLGLGVALVFGQVVHHPFLAYDDADYVLHNPVVRAGWTAEGLWWALTTRAQNLWHPLTWLSHMTDVQLFGLHAGAHHLVNVALHLFTTLLLYAVLVQATRARLPAALVAALFAWHPLHVESVAWISDRKDVLAGLCAIASLLAYRWYARKPSWARALAPLALLALGLLAKTVLLTWPLIWLLWDHWPLRRTRAPGEPAGVGGIPPAGWRRVLVEKAVVLLLPMGALFVATFANLAGDWHNFLWRVELDPVHLARGTLATPRYLFQVFWPVDLAIPYPIRWHSPPWLVAASVVLLAALTTGTLRWRRQQPAVLVGWLWFLVALAPSLGLTGIGTFWWADRYTYLPLVGVAIAVVWPLHDLAIARSRWRVPLALLAAAAVLASGIAAHRQTALWRDEVTLLEHTLAVTVDNVDAHTNLGAAYLDRGELEPAIRHLREARRLKPWDWEVVVTLGTALVRAGRVEDAVTVLQQMAADDPDEGPLQRALGDALYARGDLPQAEAAYRRALQLAPTQVEARQNLAVVLARQGRLDAAALELEQVLHAAPGLATAHASLGNVRLLQNRADEAATAYRRAVALDPRDADSCLRLAELALRSGQRESARQWLTEAVRRAPLRSDLRGALERLQRSPAEPPSTAPAANTTE